MSAMQLSIRSGHMKESCQGISCMQILLVTSQPCMRHVGAMLAVGAYSRTLCTDIAPDIRAACRLPDYGGHHLANISSPLLRYKSQSCGTCLQAHLGNKQKWRFLQKYWHKGAYFQDASDNAFIADRADDIFDRDYSMPTGEDKLDKTVLPKVGQVMHMLEQG